MISVTMNGNLGAKPVLRKTQGGTSVCDFSIASNNVHNDKDGKPQTETHWQKVTVWGKQAEACAAYLDKGSGVLVVGRLKSSEYKDEKDITRRSTQLVASKVEFLSKPRETEKENFLNNLEAATGRNGSMLKDGDEFVGTLQGIVKLDGKPHQILDTGKSFVAFPEVKGLAVHRHEKATVGMVDGKISAQLIKVKDEPWKAHKTKVAGIER